ncbi:MAG TPA: HAD family hydrolase [Ktedonobacteraceae bacterium]|nr:HAD family hydrolase [Ktedonobacteraceae bacterium]
MFWQRPDLIFPPFLDTIFFDLDGTLIKTVDSFHAADIAAAEYVAGQIHGLNWGQAEGKPLLTHDDVLLFKQAGGYNNDWDMCYLLAALSTARLREWKGSSLAGRSIAEWAELSHIAQQQGHGGVTWVQDVLPASALPDYAMIGEIYRELYWGADELFKRYGLRAHYLPDFPGFIHNEEMFFAPDFFVRLRQQGIRHMGIITGRVGPEVDIALEMMEAYCGERWWEVVVPAEVMAKPDPRALQMAIAGVAGKVNGGFYVGDTGDDLDVVLNYRAARQAHEPEILAISLVYPHEVELYQQRGADFVISHISSIFRCLP